MPVSNHHQAAVTLWWFIHKVYQERPRKLCIICDFLPLPLWGQQFTCGPTDLLSLKGWERLKSWQRCVFRNRKHWCLSYVYLVFWDCLCFVLWFFPNLSRGNKRSQKFVSQPWQNFHALCCCLQCIQAAHHLQEARTLTGQKIPHSSFSFSKADESYLQQDANGCYNAEWRCCRSLTSKPRPNCKSPCKHTLVVLLPAKELLSPLWPESLPSCINMERSPVNIRTLSKEPAELSKHTCLGNQFCSWLTGPHPELHCLKL